MRKRYTRVGKWAGLWLMGVALFALNAAAVGPTRPDVVVFVNVIVVDDGTTELARGAVFDGLQDAVGELDSNISDHFQSGVLAIANDVFAPCGVSLKLASAKAIRPRLIRSAFDPDSTLESAFSRAGTTLMLDLGGTADALDAFAATALHHSGSPNQLELFRGGPHLTVFLTGAALAQGEFRSLAVGQVQGRFSMVQLQRPEQMADPENAETFAHEWGHNLGLLHSDQDGFADTDNDPSNLMLPYRSPEGNHNLSPRQCARVKRSPLLVPGDSTIGGELQVPQTYATIQSAVAAAAPGATVLVDDGVYANPVFIDKPLQLKAKAGSRPRLWRDNDGLASLLIDGAGGVEVQGLSVTGAGISVHNSVDVTIRGNVISSNNHHGVIFQNVRGAVFTGNDVKNNAAKGVLLVRVSAGLVSKNAISGHDGQFGAGIEVIGSQRVRIENNAVFANMEGIVLMERNAALDIVDNLIIENQDYGLSLFFFETAPGVIAICGGNVVLNNRVDLSENIPPHCAAHHHGPWPRFNPESSN